MTTQDCSFIDIGMVVIANGVNLLLTVLFFSRTKGWSKAEYILGIVIISMALPVFAMVTYNIFNKREWWTIILPLILVLYCLTELLLDYILKIDFRTTTLLWPYLILFYAALGAMIGYAFLTKRIFGYLTLVTYFISLLSTWYSYSRVGHG